jgi:hypothetical protein
LPFAGLQWKCAQPSEQKSKKRWNKHAAIKITALNTMILDVSKFKAGAKLGPRKAKSLYMMQGKGSALCDAETERGAKFGCKKKLHHK